jgi:rhodanese-related sulfurtransferase
MNAKTSSTIGFERKYNSAVAPRSRSEFVHDMNENLPQRPPNMYNIVERNRGDYAHSEAPLTPRPLDAATFQREMQNGALVIDTRSPHAFCEGHIPGALEVNLHGSAFPTRVGFVAPSDSRLLLVVSNEHDLHETVTELAVVGYDQVIGYLAGGMAAWQEADLAIQTLNAMSVEQLHALRHDLRVLDVRDQGEWDEGHIKGAQHLPYYFIEQRLQERPGELQHYIDQPLAVICGSGQRSAIACSILQRHNFAQLFNVVGGMEAWYDQRFETV